MTNDHKSSLSDLTALSLFPFVAPVVASSTGGILAAVLPNPHQAMATLIVCYILWGLGFPFAMIILSSYFQRLAVHKLPPREIIVTVFLPISPFGQGGFGFALHFSPYTLTSYPLMQIGQCSSAS